MHNFIIVKLKVNLSEMFVLNEIFNDAIYLLKILIDALDYGTYNSPLSAVDRVNFSSMESTGCILFVDIILNKLCRLNFRVLYRYRSMNTKLSFIIAASSFLHAKDTVIISTWLINFSFSQGISNLIAKLYMISAMMHDMAGGVNKFQLSITLLYSLHQPTKD